MTKLAARAWEELQGLDEAEQDRLAQMVLDEIESERRWDELFAESEDLLTELGDQAMADHRAGLTRPLDPDNL